jgi:hypothetical protein
MPLQKSAFGAHTMTINLYPIPTTVKWYVAKIDILSSFKSVLSEWLRKDVRAMRPPLKRLLRRSYWQIKIHVMYDFPLKIEQNPYIDVL